MRNPLFLALILALSFAGSVRADEFDTLKAEFQAARERFWNSPERETSSGPPTPVAKFRQLAERHPGTLVELKSLAFILAESRLPPHPAFESDAQWALKRLSQQHAANPAIGDVLMEVWFSFSWVGRQPMIDFYERIIKENKDKSAVAQAKLSLATTIRRTNERGALESKPNNRPADEKRSTELFREIVTQHEGTEAAKRASHYLFEIEHLQIGMKAPDIVGKDVDGKPIRLTNFKGKIIYLDFWGFW